MVMASSGSAALGAAAIGTGVLFVYAAYTKKPLFGESGMIRTFIKTADVGIAGEVAGKAAADAVNNVSGLGKAAADAAKNVGSNVSKDK